MIPFNIPPQVGTELDYMRQAMANNKICGDGPFTRRCDEWMEQRFHAGKVLLTTSGTTALEMAALMCDLQPGDVLTVTAAPQKLQLITFYDSEQFHAIENKLMRS